MTSPTDRYQRQRDLVPRSKLQEQSASVIGVGAIGRQVALQLAAIGMPRVQLIDFDHVEVTNVTTQGYYEEDADRGRSKVEATRSTMLRIAPEMEIDTVCDRFRPQTAIQPVVFCCVDSISARRPIWRTVQSRCEFWCDGRMLGEVIRVLTSPDPSDDRHYGQTLFAREQAQRGACTAQSTIYTANIAAGLMVHQFTRWLRGLPVEQDLTLNLLASELLTPGENMGAA